MQTTFKGEKLLFDIKDFYFSKVNKTMVVEFQQDKFLENNLFKLNTVIIKETKTKTVSSLLVDFQNYEQKAFQTPENFLFNKLCLQACKIYLNRNEINLTHVLPKLNSHQKDFLTLFFLANFTHEKPTLDKFSFSWVNDFFTKLMTDLHLQIFSCISDTGQKAAI